VLCAAEGGERGGKNEIGQCTTVESLSGAGSRRHGDAWHRRLCTPPLKQQQWSTVTTVKGFEPILTV